MVLVAILFATSKLGWLSLTTIDTVESCARWSLVDCGRRSVANRAVSTVVVVLCRGVQCWQLVLRVFAINRNSERGGGCDVTVRSLAQVLQSFD